MVTKASINSRLEASGQRHNVERAILLLRQARDALVRAKAPRAADKVRRALKSAEGAHRHAHGRCTRLSLGIR